MNDAIVYRAPCRSGIFHDFQLPRLMNILATALPFILLLWLPTTTWAEEDFSAELPRIPATEPADAINTFVVADGFQIQQVAAEPLVNSPVAIEWDAEGFLYVCEMRGYSEDKDEGISRISRLEDTDDDGVFDTSVVFVDGLMWPTGIFPYDGGLFVGDAPNLFYIKDTNGDGRADTKQLVLTGFGTSNVQGLLNSFRWGLDNRIHIATSSSAGDVRHRDGNEVVNIRGRDLAIDPRTEKFELVSGASQHGMCFDNWGRKFVSSNSNHLQQVMYQDRYLKQNSYVTAPSARISIAADGPQAEVFRRSPVEPWRIVRTRLRVAGTVGGPIEGGGRAAGYFTGATGVTIYRGDAWPQSWHGLAIVGDVGSNLVHRKRLEPNGLEFIGKRIDDQSEFVASTDIWFRPAQFANAPDGSLHVIDVYREVIEHPLSLPPQIKKHLDLTSGRNRGRIYRIIPDGFQHRVTPNLAQTSTTDLVRLLEHPNAWHRETAARLLYERQDVSAVEPLKNLVANSENPLGRMHAMYALDGLGSLTSEIILARLSDKHPQVRRHAIELAEGTLDEQVLGKLATMGDDPSIDVRYQLAFSIASLQLNNRAAVLASVIACDPNDRWIRVAVQTSMSDHAGEVFARLISDTSFRSAGAVEFLKQVAGQIGRQNLPNDTERAVDALVNIPDQDKSFALSVIGALLSKRHQSGTVIAKWDKAGKLRPLDRQIDAVIQHSLDTAGDASATPSERIEAIRSLQFGRWEDVKETLVQQIDTRNPQDVQQVALTILGRFNQAGVAQPIIESWPALSPAVRETACDVMFARPDRLNLLLDQIDAGAIAASDISPARWKIATNIKSAKARVAKYVNRAGSAKRRAVIDAYQGSLQLSGDPARGRAAFAKHCAVCHRVDNQGHEIGPSLAAIKTRGRETILVNVLDPNREVNPEYLNYVLLTTDGRTVTGMIASENANSVTLRRAESATDTVSRADIEQLKSTGLSIMPEGMEESIDQQTLADIIEYLMQVK